MKRLVLITVFFMTIAFSASALNGIGSSFIYSLDVHTSGGAGGSFQLSLDKIPGSVLGISCFNNGGNVALGLYDDWWLYKPSIGKGFHFFLGLGAFTYFTFNPNYFNFAWGARIPFGLRFFPADQFEIFWQTAPHFGMNINTTSVPVNFHFSVQMGLGVRFWFS